MAEPEPEDENSMEEDQLINTSIESVEGIQSPDKVRLNIPI